MTFYNTVRLLDTGLKAGVFQFDPKDKNRMLVYRTGNQETGAPEGWYSENIHEVAQELMNDENGIAVILKEYSNRGISFEAIPAWWE